MSMLADLVEVVIGVDTHKDTHTAALLDTRTGGVLARATVSTDPDGYAELMTLAEQRSGLGRGRWRALVATAPAGPAPGR
ncbi:hypothetical protein [Micromonospora sp. M71_S20]|uniref:hypothetical protein n=1 Tax=Micromonospora sp. M71_S20 TaxID=592872 RepID=UPI0018F7BD12|nr:hypothetical protein [Micromonospora sp. M71_S20]